MKFLAYFIPAKKHNGDKGLLKEKSHDAFDGERCSKNITHEPGIIWPVGSKFKFENDSGSNTNGEINPE